MLPEVDLDIPEHDGKKERDIVVAIEHVGAIIDSPSLRNSYIENWSLCCLSNLLVHIVQQGILFR